MAALNIRERWTQVSEKVANWAWVVRLRTMIESLSPRDQRLLLLLVLFVLSAAVGGGILSGQRYLRRLESDITRKKDQLARVEQVRSEYDSLKAEIEVIEDQLKRNVDFNLTSFMERTANEVGFLAPVSIRSTGDIANQTYREISVDVKVRKESLDKILYYLYLIETAPQRLTVKDLRIRTTFRSKAELDADLAVTLLAPLET